MRFVLIAGLLLSLCAALPLYGDDQDRILAEIASTTHTDKQTAIEIVNSIIAFMTDLQSRFSYIASSTDAPAQKDVIGKGTIECCFVSSLSDVQITSPSSKHVRTQPVNVYLYRLARLQQLFGYTRVELYFRSNYLGMGQVYPVSGQRNSYEVSVSAVQIFKAWRYEQPIYTDAVAKKFRVRFTLEGDEILVKVDEVLVTQNVPNPNLQSEP